MGAPGPLACKVFPRVPPGRAAWLARALCGTKRYRACLDFLKGVVLLPSEHRDTGTAIWHAAQTALGLPLTWPENLGEGEPFPPEGAND